MEITPVVQGRGAGRGASPHPTRHRAEIQGCARPSSAGPGVRRAPPARPSPPTVGWGPAAPASPFLLSPQQAPPNPRRRSHLPNVLTRARRWRWRRGGEAAAALSRGRAGDVRRAGCGGGDVPADTSGRRGGEGEVVPGRHGKGGWGRGEADGSVWTVDGTSRA